jgi:ComF family protein
MRFLALLLDTVFLPRESEHAVRTASNDLFLSKLRPVAVNGTCMPVVSLLPYTDPLVQACVLEAKFQGNVRAAELLGQALQEYLHESLAESAAFCPIQPVLVPLPLSPARLRERGYNQTERIAQCAASGLPGLEVHAALLWRNRDTEPQTTLSGAQRRKNLIGAFSAYPCDPRRTYIVVDDVVTTGSTMKEALLALERAGARHLVPVTLAH